jgi:hypothetical protein
MWFATPAKRGKRDMMHVGKLERVLLIRVTLYFQQHHRKQTCPCKRLSTEDQDASKAKNETPQSKMPASLSTLSILPTGTNFNLTRLIFNLETASKR